MNTSTKPLLESLRMIQNHPAHAHHDIITIHHCAPVSTAAQLRASIEANMAIIAKWSNYGGSKRRMEGARHV